MNRVRYVYTPESRLRRPGELVRSMLRDLLASRELAMRLFVRNVSARYRRSVLGYVWAALPLIVGTVTFVCLRRAGVVSTGGTGVSYLLFAAVGLALWQTFVDALNMPLRAIQQSRVMLTRVNFPREAILLAGAAEVVFNFFIRCLVLLPIFAWEGFLPPASVFMAPLGVAALLGAGIAVGVLLAPLGVLYSDVEQGIATITPLWMLLTPVFYAVPPGALGEVMVRFNPVAPLLDTARAWCLTGTPDHLTGFLWCSLGVALLLALGWVAYRLALPVLAERMGE